ncbi:amidohydrolase [Microcella sp.]|uniref:amidohydrolase n=1 Tax=Microcella sp. TaxID=1913979 RepID=UPI00255EDA73|nr:amidohydrolase [Microcella sp.]MBX9471933.1 amidohydrolase [Microcella sp.]
MNRDLNDIRAMIASSCRREERHLRELSLSIHREPELAFQERRASGLIADYLEQRGWHVERGWLGLETALRASVGEGRHIALCAEYDALPEIGHGCGHHLIAAMSIGAAIALGELASELGVRVSLFGTPAEEHGGGKIALLDRGAWDDVDVTGLVHPWAAPYDRSAEYVMMSAVARWSVEFRGRSSHAAASPEEGVNASDAATIASVAFGLLRQQTGPDVRFNANVVSVGTESNIIPDRSHMTVEARSVSGVQLSALQSRLRACLEGAAIATGCSLAVEDAEVPYRELRQDPILAQFWDAELSHLGRDVRAEQHPGGSTDMGDVSHTVRTLHAYLAIPGDVVVSHTADFAQHSASEVALETMILGAQVLASTFAADALHHRTLQAGQS